MRKPTELEAVWTEYKRSGSIALRNHLVEAYLPLAHKIADQIARSLPHAVGGDEVCSAGTLGLIDAVEKFDMSLGVAFKTYCVTRIRGSINDELRSRDWAPRLVRSRAQKFGADVCRLTSELGRKPTHPEIMSGLHLSEEEYEAILADIHRLKVYHLDAGSYPGADEDHSEYSDRKNDPRIDSVRSLELEPSRAAEDNESAVALHALLLCALNERQQTIINLYYFQGLTLAEIGRRLEVSEATVCQDRLRALGRLLDESLARNSA